MDPPPPEGGGGLAGRLVWPATRRRGSPAGPAPRVAGGLALPARPRRARAVTARHGQGSATEGRSAARGT